MRWPSVTPGEYLDGGKRYRLHLPPNIPVKDFWSVLVYDPQTRSMLQTDQKFPSLSSQKEGVVVNPDTSVDLYFGPEPPAGKEANWVQTVPGKGWWVMPCASTARWSPGSTRPGALARSRCWVEKRHRPIPFIASRWVNKRLWALCAGRPQANRDQRWGNHEIRSYQGFQRLSGSKTRMNCRI